MNDPRRRAWWLCALAAIGFGLALGCSRAHYRIDADQDAYSIVEEKVSDAGDIIPIQAIEPPPQSRLYDGASAASPDFPPMPPDDPTAHPYMHCADGRPGYRGWHRDGDAPSIEDPTWRSHLPLAENGELFLSRERAVDLSRLHSREYQFQRERVYQSALALSFNRFNFEVQWFGANFTHADHFGAGSADNEHNTLTTSTNFGFRKLFGTGGQVAVDALNTFMWEFAGPSSGTVSTVLGVNFVQPLLRRAWRDVRMESLTQGERDVLYTVRGYARFTHTHYFQVVNGFEGFLSLLQQVQGIRNFETNVVSLKETLREHEALLRAGVVSRIQLDQVFQRYQQSRLELILAKNRFEDSLDTYKVVLGLPPDLPVKLDDSLLAPFQLVDSSLESLQTESDAVVMNLQQPEETPTLIELRQSVAELQALGARLVAARRMVEGEYQAWRKEPIAAAAPGSLQGGDAEFVAQLSTRLTEVAATEQQVTKAIVEAGSRLNNATRVASWRALQKLSRDQATAAADLAIVQTQIRVQRIKLEPVVWSTDVAVQVALNQRLDLMNERGRVVDAWRQIRVAADGLQADVDVIATANIGTDLSGANPVDFSASASSYRLGVRVDTPLTRLAERNAYRAELIQYQQVRREFMALEDRITQAVRRDLRQLESDRLSFEIARQSMVVAARQVEEARAQLLEPGRPTDSSNTADVLNALASIVRVKNDLVQSWVNYETSRLQLLLDLELIEAEDDGFGVDNTRDFPAQYLTPCNEPPGVPPTEESALFPPPPIVAKPPKMETAPEPPADLSDIESLPTPAEKVPKTNGPAPSAGKPGSG